MAANEASERLAVKARREANETVSPDNVRTKEVSPEEAYQLANLPESDRI